MARPRQDPASAPTPDRVLDAAEAAFARQGFDGARLEDIARAAGITRPSLLYYFASKERLYDAVVTRVFGELDAALPTDDVDALVAGFEAFLAARPSFAPLLLRELVDGAHLDAIVPVLEPVLARVAASVRPAPGVNPRATILDLAAASLVRAASSRARDALWGPGASSRPLAHVLLGGAR